MKKALDFLQKQQKKIYISGPMTGISNFNQKAFDAAEDKLKKIFFQVINPAGYYDTKDFPIPSYKELLFKDIILLSRCDAMYMLNGWENSKGAKVEHSIAVAFKMDIYYEKCFCKYETVKNIK